jgi:maltose-binding protein MalE
MKKIRKFLALGIASVMVIGTLTACGGSASTSSNGEGGKTATEAATAAEAAMAAPRSGRRSCRERVGGTKAP